MTHMALPAFEDTSSLASQAAGRGRAVRIEDIEDEHRGIAVSPAQGGRA
jgi:hypothetical protein